MSNGPYTPWEVWDRRFYRMAQEVSSWSKDPNRKVGALIIDADRRRMATGYNGFPRSIQDTAERLEDPEFKLAAMVHAEANALDNATFETRGCRMYVTRFPCLDCAKRILSKGITYLIVPEPPWDHPRWGESWRKSRDLLQLGGVNITFCAETEDPQ